MIKTYFKDLKIDRNVQLYIKNTSTIPEVCIIIPDNADNFHKFRKIMEDLRQLGASASILDKEDWNDFENAWGWITLDKFL
jgi:hypothetical protein